jgi:predicted nucleotide-binding protein
MDQNERERLRRKVQNLTGLRDQILRQDEILKDVHPRTESWQGASESIMKVLRRLFDELSEVLPGEIISFDDNNDIDGLRSQLALAHGKVEGGIAALFSSLGEAVPPTRDTRSDRPISVTTADAVDRRRVFVVHGRNMKTREAMFTFLRAIDLDPIEWEQAIEMTQQGSPYTGHAIDIAFSKAQAAVVLLTGDDMARLGKRHLTEHDPASERQLTRQARPNVIFEMGMAFGKHPDRTVIVEFGRTRELTDVIGRNTIHFRDDAATRKKIADRLTTARCLVNVQGKTEWLTAGDFSGAAVDPDEVPGQPAQPRSSRTETLATRKERDNQISALQQTVQELTQANERKTEELRELRQSVAGLELDKTIRTIGDETIDPQVDRVLQATPFSAAHPPGVVNHTEYSFRSPEDIEVRIERNEWQHIKGLVIVIVNHRLTAIGRIKTVIQTAQSFDARHKGYRDGREFSAFANIEADAINAGCSGKALWFIRKDRAPTLLAGNDDQHPLGWPDTDQSAMQRWLLSISIDAQTVPTNSGLTAVPIQAANCRLVVTWDRDKNEFFVEPE